MGSGVLVQPTQDARSGSLDDLSGLLPVRSRNGHTALVYSKPIIAVTSITLYTIGFICGMGVCIRRAHQCLFPTLPDPLLGPAVPPACDIEG